MARPRIRDGCARLPWLGAVLLAAYCALAVSLVLLGRHAILTPVVLQTQDLLLAPGGAGELTVRALDSGTGRPIPGLDLECQRSRSSGRSDAGASAVTDAEGFARWPLERMSGDDAGSRTDLAASYRVTLRGPARFLLASPWVSSEPKEHYVPVDALFVEPGMDLLLVDLEGPGADESGEAPPAEAGAARPAPGFTPALWASLRDEVAKVGSTHHRTLYLCPGRGPRCQRVKFLLMTSGFPSGLVLAAPDLLEKPLFLEQLGKRLDQLRARAAAVLCGEDDHEIYRRVFPQVEFPPWGSGR